MIPIALLILTLLVSSPIARAATAADAPSPALTVIGATPDQRIALETALDLYAAHELALPPLVVDYDGGADVCTGRGGLFVPEPISEHDADTVYICDRLPFYTVHELAHAYVSHHLSDDDRDRLTAQWDLPSWNDHDDDWSDRATEHAANSIAFTLLLDGPTENDDILSYVCSFTEVTGLPLPSSARRSCG